MAKVHEIASPPLVLQGWHAIAPKQVPRAFQSDVKKILQKGIWFLLWTLLLIGNVQLSWGRSLVVVPTLSNPTVTNITENSAELGATAESGDPFTARGTVYSISSPVLITNNPLDEGGTTVGVFSHTRTSLLPQTQYFYAGYAVNGNGTGLSPEGNFRTLSNSPTSAALGFVAAPFSSTQNNLYWSMAGFPAMGASATGYIIIRMTGSNPTTDGIVDAVAPASLSLPVGTTLVATITSGSTTSYFNSGLSNATQYNYLIVPFTWDGTNAATYNYYLTSAPVSNATTAMCQTFACNGTAFNTNNWSTASASICNTSGMTNAFTPGSIATFCTLNGMGTSSAIVIAGMTATENFTLTAAAGVINNQNFAAAIIDVAAGKLMDCSTVAFGNLTTSAYIKNGEGSLAFAGGTYTGGFTLNAGTMISRAANSMGQNSGSGILTLNGGTLAIATSGGGSLFNKYSNIIIGGDIQFGIIVLPALQNGSISFNAPMNLGNSLRTLTLGNLGTMLFAGVISNTGSGGISFTANTDGLGHFEITNPANIFNGPVNIIGTVGSASVDVRFQADASFGNVANTININGGRLGTMASTTYTITNSRGIHVGNAPGTAINVVTSGTLTYNGVISDLAGSTPGSWAKQGAGTLSLGGISTYTGATTINAGVLLLTTGTNRLPSTTTINIGLAGNTSLGTFNLGGFSQQIGGLNSIPGNNASTNNNTVNSVSAATLTFTGSDSYSFGNGTNANSGVITGAISIVKNGSGTQTLGDENTYTGTTTITNGELRFNPPINITMAGSIIMNGGIFGTRSIIDTRTITFPVFDLSENSKIDLDTTNTHTITFTAAGTFTVGKTLTIYGWKGVSGMSGTKGKIFFGNSAAALTADQLAQIQFNVGTIGAPGASFSAILLPTGELVMGEAAGCGAMVLNANDAGSGSLREVISCVAPGTTITFHASLMGSTITLTSGEIEIDKNLTISGLSNVTDLSLSGNSASRIFHVLSGKTLSLQNLSLKNANAAAPNGGALYVQGSLTLQNVWFQNNFENGVTPKGMTVNAPGGVITVIGNNVQIKN